MMFFDSNKEIDLSTKIYQKKQHDFVIGMNKQNNFALELKSLYTAVFLGNSLSLFYQFHEKKPENAQKEGKRKNRCLMGKSFSN